MNNLAYDGNAKKAQPVVRRIIRRVPVKPAIAPQAENSEIPRPSIPSSPIRVQPQNHTFTGNDDDMLAFSIITKILLPKDRVEFMNVLFQKLLLGKISFTTLSLHVSKHLELCPMLLNIWQNIINRNMNTKYPVFLKIKDVITFFRKNNLPNATIYNFIANLAAAKQNSQPNLGILENIITKYYILEDNGQLEQLMQMALDLLKLLPKAYRTPPTYPDQIEVKQAQTPTNSLQPIQKEISIKEMFETRYYPPQFTIQKRYQDISTFILKNGKEHSTHRHVSAKDTTFTPSHHQHLIPLLDKQPCFFLNYFTKSLATGHEGGSRHSPDKHQEMAITVTRDIHDVLEQPEIHEHNIDSIFYFDESMNYAGYIARVAGLSTFNESTWEKIEPMLQSKNVRKYLSNYFRKRLEFFEDLHQKSEYFCKVFLTTRPINPFLITLKKPQTYDGFNFLYFPNDDDVPMFAWSILGGYTSQRFPYTSFFFKQILPVLSDSQSYLHFIGPSSLIMVLYYYSKLCQCIAPLLNQNPSGFETYESVFEIARDQVNAKFPSTENNNRFLTKVIKSIIKNGTIVDDLSFEIYKFYGQQSTYVANIAPILSLFNSACHCLISEPRWNEIFQLMSTLGTAHDEVTLNSRFPLYSEKMKLPSKPKLYVIRTNQSKIVQVSNFEY